MAHNGETKSYDDTMLRNKKKNARIEDESLLKFDYQPHYASLS